MRPGLALIVGGTSALGQALAQAYAQRGWAIALASRRPAAQASVARDLEIRFGVSVHELLCDLEDAASVATLAQHAAELPDLRRAFFVAGDAGDPGRNLLDAAAVARIVSVSFTAQAQLVGRLLVALPPAQRQGLRLVFCGSVAGDRGRAANPVYCAAKAALDTFAEGLRQRLHRDGVRVLHVRLGWVDSRQSYGRVPPCLALSPRRAAEQIRRACERGRSVVYVPGWWRLAMAVLRWIPRWIWTRWPLGSKRS